jgi:hypothetical protein
MQWKQQYHALVARSVNYFTLDGAAHQHRISNVRG